MGVRHTVLAAVLLVTTAAFAQGQPKQGGVSEAPDSWLLRQKGPGWWYQTKPSPSPVELKQRPASASEQAVVDQMRGLVASRPARAAALMDGDAVVYSEFKSPAAEGLLLAGFSLGKSVTAMAVGQGICAGALKLETKAKNVMPELAGKALGEATVRDLLSMASGAADPIADSEIWTPEQAKQWDRGELNLAELVSLDRVAQAAHGVFSAYKPGEHFRYKATDPLTVGIMASRATGKPFSQMVQETVLDPMGAAHAGLYAQDRQKNPLSASGVRLTLDDWMRFALWVKRSSKEPGCFGDFVRAAMTKQVVNGPTKATRRTGMAFGAYGYFLWLDNEVAPGTAWASGYGGQRIGWDLNSDRMVLVFSNLENWMGDLYGVARAWRGLRD